MNGSGPRLLRARPRSPSTLLQRCARMHFAKYVGDLPNKLHTVHDKLVVHVRQSRNFRRISLEEERIAGMLLWAAECPQAGLITSMPRAQLGRISSSLPSHRHALQAIDPKNVHNFQVIDDGGDADDDESVTFSASRRCSSSVGSGQSDILSIRIPRLSASRPNVT